jgi:peptide/nickel transport system substrate-binding protein
VAGRLGARTVEFTLPRARDGFEKTLSVGILSKAVWEGISPEEFAFSEYNVRPVGTGPFKIEDIEFGDSGLPEEMTLSRFDEYALGPAYLDEVHLRFFKDEKAIEKAFKTGSIDTWSRVPPSSLEAVHDRSTTVHSFPLSRAFLVFFNFRDSDSPLLSNAVRRALDGAIDRTELVETVLQGHGRPLRTLSDYTWGESDWPSDEESAILEESEGERLPSFSFELRTVDVPELVRVAEFLKESWSAIGADVNIQQSSVQSVGEDVIGPRNFEAFLYGITLEHPEDECSWDKHFWISKCYCRQALSINR